MRWRDFLVEIPEDGQKILSCCPPYEDMPPTIGFQEFHLGPQTPDEYRKSYLNIFKEYGIDYGGRRWWLPYEELPLPDFEEGKKVVKALVQKIELAKMAEELKGTDEKSMGQDKAK